MAEVTPGFGIVAMAAYQPPEALFARQLLSIRAQTHSDFRCLISVDGDSRQVAATVRSICGDDDRFEVIGFDDRRGFYGNFERVLDAVPPEARWVALSDQDDHWYPDKLAKLLPHLEDHALVSGQARIVRDDGQVLVGKTNRRRSRLVDLFTENQVTGSLSVLRADLLPLALPFPRLDTPAQYHDHWLGVCAGASGGYTVVDTTVQDYIQHSDNVVGENRTGPAQLFGRVRDLGRRHEGSASPAALARFLSTSGIGWRSVMAEALAERRPPRSLQLDEALLAYLAGAPARSTARAVLAGRRRGAVPPRRVLELLVSLGARAVTGATTKGRP